MAFPRGGGIKEKMKGPDGEKQGKTQESVPVVLGSLRSLERLDRLRWRQGSLAIMDGLSGTISASAEQRLAVVHPQFLGIPGLCCFP